jgi:TolB protein
MNKANACPSDPCSSSCCCSCRHGAQAALEIRITQGIEGAMPIAVVPFGWQGTGDRAPEDLAAIIQANLHRSGQFSPLERGRMPQRPVRSADVDFRQWRNAGVEHVVIGSLQATGSDSFVVEFRLFDAVSGRQTTGHRIPVSSRNDLRRAAHMISDIIYQQITGVRGAFSTASPT